LPAIKIGARPSRLAVAQVKEITDQLGGLESRLKLFATSGDCDMLTPIDRAEGSDFFTDLIEQALLKREIDLAVHSAKDLPDKLPDGLVIAVTTKSIETRDVLVSKGNLKLNEVPAGSRVGTSSRRRKEQLRELRPDIEPLDLRGNIDERLAKLDQDDFEAIILAGAALMRLDLKQRISEWLNFETADGQGSLALEVRANDQELIKWLREKFI